MTAWVFCFPACSQSVCSARIGRSALILLGELACTVLAAKPFDAMRRIIEAPTFGRPFDLTYLKFDDDKHKIVIDSHFINWGLVAEFDHACEHKLRWLGRDIKPLVAAAFVILRRKVQ